MSHGDLSVEFHFCICKTDLSTGHVQAERISRANEENWRKLMERAVGDSPTAVPRRLTLSERLGPSTVFLSLSSIRVR